MPRARSKSRVNKTAPVLISVEPKDDVSVTLKIAQHWFQARKHTQIEKLFEKNKHISLLWHMLSSVQNQRVLGLQVPYTAEDILQEEEQTPVQEEKPAQPQQQVSLYINHSHTLQGILLY
jgi:hypothetical protein